MANKSKIKTCIQYLSNPQLAINILLHKVSQKYNITPPEIFLHKLINKLYVNYDEHQITEDFISQSSKFLNTYYSKNVDLPNKKKAIIMLLKGHFAINNLHNYWLACVFKKMGYEVTLVMCNGFIERCGNSQEEYYFRNPPFACNVCKKITSSFDTSGFNVVSLNNYRHLSEENIINKILNDEAEKLPNGFNRNDILRYAQPYLLRFFHGDPKKINFENAETVLHLKSAMRYLLRYTKMLDDIKPDKACFYHGIYFPEFLLLREAEQRGISYLCTEKGVKKGTICVTHNIPAVHFNNPQLWENKKSTINEPEIKIVSAYLNGRTKGNEDPAGFKRNISITDQKKYDDLKKKPYVLFFAPVIHDTVSMEKNNAIGDAFDNIKELVKKAIEYKTRLVIRCHPDEMATINPSHYTVKQFLADCNLLNNEYIICLEAKEIWNGYELSKYAKAVVVYSGTLGMELPALGYAIYNLANSHYASKGFTNDVKEVNDLNKIFTLIPQFSSSEAQTNALKYLYYYSFILSINVENIISEPSPFNYVLAAGNNFEIEKKQLDEVEERIRLFSNLNCN